MDPTQTIKSAHNHDVLLLALRHDCGETAIPLQLSQEEGISSRQNLNQLVYRLKVL